MRFRRRAAWGASSIGIVALAVMAWGGVSLAASGGGYNPDQNDCPWNSGAWNTPPNTVTPGCHNFAANVETGNTTNGDPNSNNTRFAEFGIDELPNNPGNPSFGFEENVGDPGTPDSPHSGCLAANTDGTGGGTGVGCGDNPNGAGFSSTWDYYFIYCPVMAALPVGSTPDAVGTATMGAVTGPALYQCSEPYAQPTLTVDKGTQTALDQILTQGLLVYIGAVDNLDNGEHDGFSGNNNTDGALNGSSDGGGAVLSLTPQSAADSPTAAHPEGLLNASEGECADSICFEATTQQQTVYYGCTTSTSSGAYNGTSGANSPQNNAADDQCTTSQQSTNAYQNNTPASTQESYNCNGGGPDTTETACYTNQDGTSNPGGANAYRQGTPQQVYAEPGIQTYQDPDPQRSPALPVATPGLYAGTCGVYVNDGGGDGNPGLSGLLTGGAFNLDPGYIGPSQC